MERRVAEVVEVEGAVRVLASAVREGTAARARFGLSPIELRQSRKQIGRSCKS